MIQGQIRRAIDDFIAKNNSVPNLITVHPVNYNKIINENLGENNYSSIITFMGYKVITSADIAENEIIISYSKTTELK